MIDLTSEQLQDVGGGFGTGTQPLGWRNGAFVGGATGLGVGAGIGGFVGAPIGLVAGAAIGAGVGWVAENNRAYQQKHGLPRF